MTLPFADGSISMRLYPHNDLPAGEVAGNLCSQAVLAAGSGFDGVMTSEHHGGFAGYLPNPLQVTNWLVERMPSGWAAPCPLLLPLRPVVSVAEEIAWLAALHPGRVGIGVASGALPLDFEAMEVPLAEAVPRFKAALPRLAAMLRGDDLGDLAGDPALAACAADPVPVVSTAMSTGAVKRAAANRIGVLYDGGTAATRLAALTDAYLAAGGTGPRILIRRVWLGPPPQDVFENQLDVYRSYSPSSALEHWRGTGFVCHDNPADLAEEVATSVAECGATCLNLRVHVPGVSAARAAEQIRAVGAYVVPLVRPHFRNPGS
jgi:alkanesulfonate monooxygenase SsuD/methylene tetrahydromethanopterin reductase-like flavin-dependent oxidoreductase (luciferase family)